MRSPHAFDLLGVDWDSPAEVKVAVRVRRVRSGRWSRWLPAEEVADHAPDGSLGTVRGTGPVWTDRSDRYQLRLSRPARGLRVRFVRVHPGRVRPVRPRAHAAQAQLPPVVPRWQWAGTQCNPRRAPAYGTVQMAFVHHTAGTNYYSPRKSAAIVLAICRFHRNTRHWNDIAYNFLVDRYGQVFEGRAGGIDQAVVGAHTQGYNSQATGIATLGTFQRAGLTSAAMSSLTNLVAWKLSLHAVPVTGQAVLFSHGGNTNRFPRGLPVTFENISGHRDADRTDCPGAALYAQLPEIRARAAALTGEPAPVQ
jgi:uncharacterized protein with LGFP repeats